MREGGREAGRWMLRQERPATTIIIIARNRLFKVLNAGGVRAVLPRPNRTEHCVPLFVRIFF